MRAKRQKPQIRQVAIQKHENLCQSLQKQEWAGSDSWATLPLKDMKVEVQRPWLPPRGSTTGVLGLRLSALPSAAASDDRAYFRSNCLGEGLRVVLTFLWRQKKKKREMYKEMGLKVPMNKYNYGRMGSTSIPRNDPTHTPDLKPKFQRSKGMQNK